MERQAEEEAQDAARDVEELGAARELHAHQPYRDAGLTIWEVATNIPSSTSSPPTSPPHLVRQLPQQSLRRTSPMDFSHPQHIRLTADVDSCKCVLYERGCTCQQCHTSFLEFEDICSKPVFSSMLKPAPFNLRQQAVTNLTLVM